MSNLRLLLITLPFMVIEMEMFQLSTIAAVVSLIFVADVIKMVGLFQTFIFHVRKIFLLLVAAHGVRSDFVDYTHLS